MWRQPPPAVPSAARRLDQQQTHPQQPREFPDRHHPHSKLCHSERAPAREEPAVRYHHHCRGREPPRWGKPPVAPAITTPTPAPTPAASPPYLSPPPAPSPSPPSPKSSSISPQSLLVAPLNSPVILSGG